MGFPFSSAMMVVPPGSFQMRAVKSPDLFRVFNVVLITVKRSEWWSASSESFNPPQRPNH